MNDEIISTISDPPPPKKIVPILYNNYVLWYYKYLNRTENDKILRLKCIPRIKKNRT